MLTASGEQEQCDRNACAMCSKRKLFDLDLPWMAKLDDNDFQL